MDGALVSEVEVLDLGLDLDIIVVDDDRRLSASCWRARLVARLPMGEIARLAGVSGAITDAVSAAILQTGTTS